MEVFMEPNRSVSQASGSCPFASNPPAQPAEGNGAIQRIWDWAKNTIIFGWSVQKSGGMDFFISKFYDPETEQWVPVERLSVAHKPRAVVFTSYDDWSLFLERKGMKLSGGAELSALGNLAIGNYNPLTLDDPEYHKIMKKLCTDYNFGLDKIQRNFGLIMKVAERYFSSGAQRKINFSKEIIQYISRANVMALCGPLGSKSFEEIEKLVFNEDGTPNPDWDKVPEAVEVAGQTVSNAVLFEPGYFAGRVVDKVVPDEIYKTEYQKSSEILKGAAKKIYQASQEALKSEKEPEKHYGKDVRGIVEAMIHMDEFPYGHIESIAKLILVIGQRTTTSALESCMKNLVLFPEWQDRLYKEIEDHIQGNSYTHENVNSLEWLHRFIEETLRLNPPVPIQTRDTKEDIVFKGREIPAYSTVGFVHYAAQRNPKDITDPNKFDPTRFEGEEGKKLEKIMKTFSQAPHNCCGKWLALTGTIKAALVQIIRNYKIQAANYQDVVDMRHVGGIILKHDRPLKVVFIPR
jgi:cytochrome P450